MNRIASLIASFAVTIPSPAQEPESRPERDPLESAYRELRVMLDATSKTKRPRNTRRQLIEEFLVAHASRAPRRSEVLKARCRLGSLCLTDFDHEAARKQFDAVLRHAGTDEIDLRGRAKYGLAQSYELAGKPELAANLLRRLQQESRGTRYARFAEIALARIARARTQLIGSAAPEFGPRLDIDQKARRLSELRGAPAIVIFGSASDVAGVGEIRRWLDTCERAGVEPEQVIVFLMHTDDTGAAALRKREAWKCAVIECEREFLDPATLAFRVQELPTLFLVGPDGKALARNPSTRRLREALAKLL